MKPKTKRQEKVVKAFLPALILISKPWQKRKCLLKTPLPPKITPREKEILGNLEASVAFVKNYKKGETKIKSLNQLLNEL